MNYRSLVLSAFLLISIGLYPQKKEFEEVLSEYKICNWKDNKQAAVALTFDDWTLGHPAIVVPELQKRDMVATFNIFTSTIKDWEPLRKAANLGNEMANHSATHPHLNNDSLYKKEVLEPKEKIEKEVGYPVFTFAYPYGELNETLVNYLKKSGHIAARGVINPYSPQCYSYHNMGGEKDYFNTFAYSVMTETKTADYAAEIEKAVKNGGLLTYLYHSVYNKEVPDFSYAWVLDTLFREQLDTLASYKDRVWITTYANAVKYHKEAQCAKLVESKSKDKSKQIFLLTDNLDNKLYDQTLTVIVNMKGESKIKSVKQNSVEIPFKYISKNQIQFDAVPDGGEIIVES
ncbi:MAG TPA: polysaccharide deacetylase family protein [Paludibacteraceae bacterium]|nr:polysaccharide deacetylase family protein [Paludibacteraceae bacterium]HOU69737.1 polysaccharide deacetylase family protein [Paludibacteraceae bacterium]HQJ90937.1 polysaccharide deacetylase family protein [Paludibacteraceae bacterium]